ncbi:MAG TPA: adenylate/guanylate cyclase domain-containing protein [Gammaproteobacteria bacterium]
MTKRSVRARFALCVLAAALAWFGTRHGSWLAPGSAWLEDVAFANFSVRPPQNRDVVVVAITEDTLSRLPFRSPLDRGFLAGLIDELSRRQVRAVGLDIIFDQPTKPEDDEALLAAIARFPGPVVVAAGNAADGLTPRQLEFQHSYLEGRKVGFATMFSTAGVVRNIYPTFPGGSVSMPSFAAALAEAVGVDPPRAAVRLHFRLDAAGSPPPPFIRSFPAHHLSSLPEGWLADSIVLVGADLPNEDRFRTPLSVLGGEHATMAGVEIHAQALAQLLDGTRYPAAPGWLEGALLLTAVSLGFALPFTGLGLLAKTILSIGAVLGYWAAGLVHFMHGGVLLPPLGPPLGLLLSVGFGSAYARYEDRAEKRFIRQAFQRYVSPAVIEHILSDPRKLGLGGEKRRMSFVFSDLAGFTTLAERHDPEVVVALLQGYFDGMLRIAFAHGGTVDRLVGDSVAILFGAPAEQPDHAARAVRCAVDIDRYCEAFRLTQAACGVEMGITRIGVHSGTAIVGNVGSTDRLHYTAHGDCVNVAARLESANKQLGTRLCISAETAQQCSDVSFRPVGDLVVKGKTEGLECVAPWDGLPAEHRDDYLAAYAALQRGDSASLELFAALHRCVPDDPLVAYHYRRLACGATGARIVLEEK